MAQSSKKVVNGLQEIFGQIKMVRGRRVYLRAVLIVQRCVRWWFVVYLGVGGGGGLCGC